MSPVRDRITDSITRERVLLEVRRARRPFVIWLALVALGVVSVALLLARLHVPWPWQNQYDFRVAVTSATGVSTGDEVRIAGVQVGRVTGVSLAGTTPTVQVSVDPRYAPLYRNARLALRPNTPLEDMYLDVESRGTPSAGPVRQGALLAAAQTQAPVQIGQVIDIFNAGVRPRVTATLDTLGAGLADHGADLRAALIALAPFLRNAQRLTVVLTERQAQTRQLVHNFGEMTSELAQHDRELTGLVHSGAATMGELGSVEQSVAGLLAQLPPTLRELPTSLATVRAATVEVDPALRALLPAARALGPALSALRSVSPIAQTALTALDQPLPRLHALLSAADPTAGTLDGAFTALRPQAPKLNAITAALVPCENGIQDFFQYTLSVTKLATPHGVLPRGFGVFGAQVATGMLGATNLFSELSPSPSCAPGGPS